MRVLVTGGMGKVGKIAVAYLREKGFDVTVLGRKSDQTIKGANYIQCDLLDFEKLKKAFEGHNAIIHLAAQGTPVGIPGREVFRINDLGTFHVYEAAAMVGINRVVTASSINALGYYFGDRSVPINYIPLDEDHPSLTTDAYSFSKQIMESIGRYFWERDNISGVMLRMPVVIRHEKILANENHYLVYNPEVITNLLSLEDQQRSIEIKRMDHEFDQYRRSHRTDSLDPLTWWATPDAVTKLTKDEFLYMHHKVNFFTYLDELDVAEALYQGLVMTYKGCHTLFVNANHNSLGLPLSKIAKLYDVQLPSGDLSDSTSIISTRRAKELINFQPKWHIEGCFLRKSNFM